MQLIQDDYAAQEFLERHPAPNMRCTGRVLQTVVFLAALGCLITSITLGYSPVWAAAAGALAVVWIPAFIVTQHAQNTHLLALRHHALWWLRHRDAAQIQRGVPASLLAAWGRAPVHGWRVYEFMLWFTSMAAALGGIVCFSAAAFSPEADLVMVLLLSLGALSLLIAGGMVWGAVALMRRRRAVETQNLTEFTYYAGQRLQLRALNGREA